MSKVLLMDIREVSYIKQINSFYNIFLFLELIYITILVIHTSIAYGFYKVLNYSAILYLIRLIVIGIMYNVATMSIVFMIAIITKVMCVQLFHQLYLC